MVARNRGNSGGETTVRGGALCVLEGGKRMQPKNAQNPLTSSVLQRLGNSADKEGKQTGMALSAEALESKNATTSGEREVG